MFTKTILSSIYIEENNIEKMLRGRGKDRTVCPVISNVQNIKLKVIALRKLMFSNLCSRRDAEWKKESKSWGEFDNLTILKCNVLKPLQLISDAWT